MIVSVSLCLDTRCIADCSMLHPIADHAQMKAHPNDTPSFCALSEGKQLWWNENRVAFRMR